MLHQFGHAQTVQKADEWRNLLTISPVILWLVWKDDSNDIIPDTEPPVSPNEKISTTHSRKRRSLYDAILYLCAGVRLLSTKTISMAQAAVGQQYLMNYCQRMLLLGVKLSPNHHFAMHFEPMIKLFGPVYGWWLFAYERFNGMLEKVKLNGHDGGRMELTMLRNWVQTHLIYDLSVSVPDDAQPYERELLSRVIKSGGRGSMLSELASLLNEQAVCSVRLPKRLPKFINLHKYTIDGLELDIDIYSLLYSQASSIWSDLNLRRELSSAPGKTFLGEKVARRLPFVKKDAVRYGCLTNIRTKKDSYAFVIRNSVRVPVQILDLFMLEITTEDPIEQKHHHVCALIRRFKSDNEIPPLPWDTL